ncbi:MAG: VOC family protein [Acidimicrobiaceae bacterium]|nr:VOC family protein [Acidimicrobiaceae bacterium]MCY4280981.1 VOC family protein [Acidimicrobiaceae bacterium]MCY4295177.1 VOC family protein [Acidimicrobiaceae bacterium]
MDGASEAIDFYTSVLGFEEGRRMVFDGRVGHAELRLGDSVVMLSDEWPDMDVRSPKAFGGTAVAMSVRVTDCDAVYAAALAAGADELRPPEDQFYGDRAGQFTDPWGHRWSVHTQIEEVDDAELDRRAAEMMGASE